MQRSNSDDRITGHAERKQGLLGAYKAAPFKEKWERDDLLRVLVHFCGTNAQLLSSTCGVSSADAR